MWTERNEQIYRKKWSSFCFLGAQNEFLLHSMKKILHISTFIANVIKNSQWSPLCHFFQWWVYLMLYFSFISYSKKLSAKVYLIVVNWQYQGLQIHVFAFALPELFQGVLPFYVTVGKLYMRTCDIVVNTMIRMRANVLWHCNNHCDWLTTVYSLCTEWKI